MNGLTRTRIVALVLIGLIFLGLAYIKVASADEAISVPKGAMAGDLILHPCTYSTEDGGYAADCGTLVVPENRADPQSRLIAVPVTRIHARSESPAEPIFRLQGGPGISNMEFSMASRFAEHHDVVVVGYRGVEGSVRLDCREVESAVAHSPDPLAEKSLNAYVDGFRACAARLEREGVDVAGYGLPQQVEDLEAVRKALGYDRIDLLSESVGTRTAMIYAWRHPDSIHRSVMISVNPPGHFVWDGKTTDEQIQRYSVLCAEDSSCSGRTDDLAALMRRTDVPAKWLFLPVEDGNVRIASFFGLMETTMESAPLASPMTIDSWLADADGDASGFWLQSLSARLFLPKAFVWGQYASVGRLDAAEARDYLASSPPDSILDDAGTEFMWGGGRLADAWPATPGEDDYDRVRTSSVETLLVSGALDFAAPPQAATNELLPYLPNGEQVLLPGIGHSLSFWTQQADAGTHLVNTYFDTGRVDRSRYEAQNVDFTPEVTQAALGKGIAGTMVGLAVLTVLSLLWLGLRRKPRFGRKSSAVLRSLYPVVLGLGGWLAGVLLVVTTMPETPLDDERLAILSVGLPVGLGIYWAWVNRESRATSKLIGFALGVGGALGGAWLGFHAGTELLALLTAILGAIAGANLALVVLDVVRAQRAVEPAYRAAPGGGPVSAGISVGRSSGR
jgi:pimeloyl-ACP methyl ester carboxylesterase